MMMIPLPRHNQNQVRPWILHVKLFSLLRARAYFCVCWLTTWIAQRVIILVLFVSRLGCWFKSCRWHSLPLTAKVCVLLELPLLHAFKAYLITFLVCTDMLFMSWFCAHMQFSRGGRGGGKSAANWNEDDDDGVYPNRVLLRNERWNSGHLCLCSRDSNNSRSWRRSRRREFSHRRVSPCGMPELVMSNAYNHFFTAAFATFIRNNVACPQFVSSPGLWSIQYLHPRWGSNSRVVHLALWSLIWNIS